MARQRRSRFRGRWHVAREFGPYVLRDVIGRGGMGVVYRAFDTKRERTVAIKLLSADLANDATYTERFLRESRLNAGLHDPHIIPVHDFGEIDGQLYIDMPLVEGQDLGQLLARDGRQSTATTAELIEQVAAALDAAHSAGLVHRDVKPSNVLVTNPGAGAPFAYLADFGLARSRGQASVTTDGPIGTIAYLAPERVAGESGDERCDVYSLACMAFEVLTGRKPFAGDPASVMYSHANAERPKPSSFLGKSLPSLDAVIAKGMAVNPADRYARASAFAASLREATHVGENKGTETQQIADLTQALAPAQPQTLMAAVRAFTRFTMRIAPRTSRNPTEASTSSSKRRRRLIVTTLLTSTSLLVVVADLVASSRDHLSTSPSQSPARGVSASASPSIALRDLTAYPVGEIFAEGSQGNYVQMIQTRLNAVMGGVTVTGKFGTQTTDAVLAFQHARGIQADGRVGPQTWSDLFPRFSGRSMALGSYGASVELVQQQLIVVTGSVLTVDGMYGRNTRAVVTAFQRTHHLPANGVIDRNSWESLFSALPASL